MGTNVGNPINVSHEDINGHLGTLLRLVYNFQNRTVICKSNPPMRVAKNCKESEKKGEDKNKKKRRRREKPTSPIGLPGNGELNHNTDEINSALCKAAQILQLYKVSTPTFHF